MLFQYASFVIFSLLFPPPKNLTVGVGTRVGHGEHAGFTVLHVRAARELVVESAPVDALAPRPVALRGVAPLRHEPGDDAVQLVASRYGGQAVADVCAPRVLRV